METSTSPTYPINEQYINDLKTTWEEASYLFPSYLNIGNQR